MRQKMACRQGGARWDFMGDPTGWVGYILAPGSPYAAKQGYGEGLWAELEKPCVSCKPPNNSPGMPLAAAGFGGGLLNTGRLVC